MSEQRYTFATNEKWFLFDNETEDFMDMEDCKDKLNEQQATISKLEEENEQLQEIINKLEEAIEKRGYDSIDEFW